MRAGTESLVNCITERAGTGEALGEVVESVEVADPGGEPLGPRAGWDGCVSGWRSLRYRGDRWVDSGHIRGDGCAHGRSLPSRSDCRDLIANPLLCGAAANGAPLPVGGTLVSGVLLGRE
ncbi:hypothetical protein SXIM_25920 [Streptomyces xiamenensis]|uniref:Uncharacterized protein n=1 Tax=Streptomyces xiamenensis TaxID=408015 RepID=A0A0F7CP36_9ACTN|nr:hypothetical protein SXIM_25920 [Streptomyces xiamenensis]